YGVAYDDSVSASQQQDTATDGLGFSQAGQYATCPNCDTNSIDLAQVPRNEGDQLLVFKHAYYLKPPARWDVAVFQNPMKPTQAYVKRVVGLPSEAVQVKEGDLYINGEIQRKDLKTQRAVRLLVHDHQFHPSEDDFFQPRFFPVEADSDQEQNQADAAAWEEQPAGFVFASDSRDADAWSWVRYQHWVRQGGHYQTEVPLEHWPEEIEKPEPVLAPIQYDELKQQLTCKGAMPAEDCHRLLNQTEDDAFRYAVALLYEKSHVAPVMDRYAYNSGVENQTAIPVHDFLFTCDLQAKSPEGELAIELFDGQHHFRNIIDFRQRQ
ncbi:MAG TPA: signal peptidase I, partial [Planctomycetaceae bacterium]|nr:signal peptidase I [Planctomycetaceae bacterium]